MRMDTEEQLKAHVADTHICAALERINDAISQLGVGPVAGLLREASLKLECARTELARQRAV